MDKKQNFELNTELRKDVQIGDYTNLPCGLELEAETNGQGQVIATHFEVEYNQTDGQVEKIHKVNVDVGQFGRKEIEVPTNEDKYKGKEDVTQVYPDASIGSEVVTRPVQIKELSRIKSKVFDYMKGIGADFFADGKGGLHMTFLTNKHISLSYFDPTVVANLIQLVRAYFKEIVNEFPGENGYTRKLGYRRLPSLHERNNPGADGKYCGIHTKKDEDGNIKMVEIRIPDGTKDWKLVVKQVKFWSAMIRHAAVITRYGRLSIPQEVWDKQTAWVDTKSNSRARKFKTVNCPRIKDLYKLIDNSLKLYGFYTKEADEKETQIMEMRIAGKTNIEIAKEVYGKSNSNWSKKVERQIRKIDGGY